MLAGCATVTYLHDNAMMVTMSFGDRVLRNITVNSKYQVLARQDFEIGFSQTEHNLRVTFS